ncbi:mechanosensitive ion channel [Tianweitania sp. BSSL-BM11]|uniref:Mechanosensitive ion channel n=1 Tax=Tianweitania aestuarii TaxID=2814886 RepID=A0ABS5RVG2_9HYPH|nr:mechanosensitive ion channel domain-containing protein [Tianweitania aestuarii]MBS9720967.1 mechanosensitive ion channel [Tianweitania aestuarii]
MSKLLRLLFALFLLSSPALAQVDASSQTEAPQASVDDLVRLLENEKTRNELIERLRTAAPPQNAEQAAQQAEGMADPTIARQIAEYTRTIAEGASNTVGAMVDLVGEVDEVFAGSATRDYSQFLGLLTQIGILAGILIGGYFLLRGIAAWLEHKIYKRVSTAGWVPRAFGMFFGLLLRMGAVIAAWAAGYAVSLYLLGGSHGRMTINHTLLLNAFLAVETCRVVLLVLLQPHSPRLRFIRMSDTTAAYWYFWVARIIGLAGYTFMFFAPVLAATVSPNAAQALRILVMLTTLIIGIVIVLQNKDNVRRAMMHRVSEGHNDVLAKTLAFVGTYWHIIAIIYLVAIFVLWLANPEDALPFVLGATIQSIVSVAIGLLIIAFISRFMRAGIWLPEDVKERLPLLEARLHAFVPRVMQAVRTVVLIGILIAIAQAWGLIDFLGWAASETGQRLTGSVISALIILLVGFVIYLAVSSWVEYRLNPNFGTIPTARERTLLSLFRNAFTVALTVFVVMLALAQIGINIAPLLAGAGVLGLAIGFGAQKFVQDIITGVFIQLENIMNEGDVVEAGGKSGVVEKLTIRSVSIRSLDGTLHLIPFSSVDMVSNSMKGFSYHLAEIGVAYDSDIDTVRLAMNEAFEELMQTDFSASIIEPLDIQGITLFGDSAITVRGRIKTLPGSQWAIGRRYNEAIKTAFERHGIEIPFPQVTYHAAAGAKPAADQPAILGLGASGSETSKEPKEAGAT